MKKSLLFPAVFFSLFAAAQVRRLPKLEVAPGGRYFQTEHRQPFFWLGDTGWLLFIKLNQEEILQYLDTRKAQGYNVIQVMVIHDVTHAVNKYGDSALVLHNLSAPLVTPGHQVQDPLAYDFWDHVDFAIDAAAGRGLYMALVPVWGTNVKNGLVTEQQAASYARFLTGRYKNKSNIIWLNGGDINGSDSINTWKVIGSTLKREDKNHLVTFHPRGRTTSSRWFHSEKWLDFNMFQSGHRNYIQDTTRGETHYGEDNWKYILEDHSKRPLKPSLDGEPSYEGIPHGLHDTTQAYWNEDDLRRYAYWSVFAGGAGFTYGHNAVMQFYQQGDKGSAFGARKFWQDALQDGGAIQMQYLKKLILSRPFFERLPDQSLVLDNGEKYERLMATRGKRFAFIYNYTGRNIRVQMGKLPGKRIKATWFDPSSGKISTEGVFANNGVKVFDPPGAHAPGNDIVLILDSVDQ